MTTERFVHELTDTELRDLIKESVQGSLTAIGVQVDKPIEMQTDFRYLREWRIAMQTVRSRGLMTVVALVVAGVLAALWAGIRSFLNQ